jgi:predicted MFS family arabinose efflux permease
MLADGIGMVPLLAIQALAMLAGAIAVWRLQPKAPPLRRPDAPAALQSLRDGLRVARCSAEIWPVLVLISGVGLFYVATFFVVLPVVVHDVYGGGSARLAVVTFILWLGIIAASVGLRRAMADLQRRGRAMVIAFGCGALLLLASCTLPPFPAFLGLVFLWGATQGVIITQGRTIVQMAAPPEYRGRLLAMFQLCYLGSTPIGAPLLGMAAGTWGSGIALWLAAVGVAFTIAVVAARSTIWRHALLPAEA